MVNEMIFLYCKEIDYKINNTFFKQILKQTECFSMHLFEVSNSFKASIKVLPTFCKFQGNVHKNFSLKRTSFRITFPKLVRFPEIFICLKLCYSHKK